MLSNSHILCSLLRATLFDEPLVEADYASITAEEWDGLFHESMRQCVAALVWDAVRRLPEEMWPPRAVRIPWMAEMQKTIDDTTRKHLMTQKLTKFFSEHGVDTYILKGDSICACYPQPQLRSYVDVDIYQGRQWEQGDKLVEEHLGVKICRDHHHHTTYTIDKVKFENHYHLLNHYKYFSNRRYEREMLQYFGTPTFDALFLIRHSSCHFAVNRVTLRIFCDWMMFVRKHEGDVEWPIVLDFCQRYNMHRFLGAVMALIEDNFHYTFASLPRSNDADLEQRILEDVFSAGNNAKESRLSKFFRNRWKLGITFTEGPFVAFLQRIVSLLSHEE